MSAVVEPDLLEPVGLLCLLDPHQLDVIQIAGDRHHEPGLSVPQAEVHLLLLRKHTRSNARSVPL